MTHGVRLWQQEDQILNGSPGMRARGVPSAPTHCCWTLTITATWIHGEIDWGPNSPSSPGFSELPRWPVLAGGTFVPKLPESAQTPSRRWVVHLAHCVDTLGNGGSTFRGAPGERSWAAPAHTARARLRPLSPNSPVIVTVKTSGPYPAAHLSGSQEYRDL